MRLTDSPFSLVNDQAYQRWRARKLQDYPGSASDLVVAFAACQTTDAELTRLETVCRKTNMVIYRLPDPECGDKTFVRELGRRLGLEHLDGNLCADNDSITSLQVMAAGRHAGYIPYTNKPLSWHTDGYYNAPAQQIRAIVMHCAQPAAEGGDNMLLDHEIAYIQLRDRNPDYIRALMREDVMTIPPNVEAGEMLRDTQSGPVFSVDEKTGQLHMRYSARTRNIVWRDDALTRAAVTELNGLMTAENPYVFRYRLNAGEGIICNNVLHNRTGFTDDTDKTRARLLYRARYYDRVVNTDSVNG
jgi:hypothetical protein